MHRRISFLFIVFFVLSLPCVVARARTPHKELTVERALEPHAFGGHVPARLKWAPNQRSLYFFDSRDNIEGDFSTLMVMDTATGKEHVALDQAVFRKAYAKIAAGSTGAAGPYSFKNYLPSPDGASILLPLRNGAFLWNIKRATLKRLTGPTTHAGQWSWSPDGSTLAFVSKGNLQTVNAESGATHIVARGDTPLISCASPDWLYAEELDLKTAFWWSPDGQRIAYLRFNESGVPTYPIVDETERTPVVKAQFYPKAGEKNPVVSLHVADLKTGKDLPVPGAVSGEGYLPRVSWLPDSSGVAYEILNRLQTRLKLYLYDLRRKTTRTLLNERSKTWVNVLGKPHFLRDGKRFLWLSERDGFSHLYLCSTVGGIAPLQLTRGRWVVDNLLAVDEANGCAYVSCNRESPLGRQILRVSLNGKSIQCISVGAGWHQAIFTRNGLRYVDAYSRVSAPDVVSVIDIPSGRHTTIASNPSPELAEYGFSKPVFTTIRADDGTLLHCSIIKPADFERGKRYPAIVEVYQGPGYQLVQNRWNGRWAPIDQLFAQAGFVYFTLDGRGSAGRGKAFEDVLFKRFGRTELEDQLAGVAFLKKLSYVDPGRIGIWGWSYGGFMTLYALTHSTVFRCGFAVAPVVDWKSYDTCYTERYLKLPSGNPDGYRNSSPVYFLGDLHGILGEAQGLVDNNVHFQNSALLMDALYKAGKSCEEAYYPRMSHGIKGREARIDLFRRILAFFKKNLAPGVKNNGGKNPNPAMVDADSRTRPNRPGTRENDVSLIKGLGVFGPKARKARAFQSRN